MSDLLIQLPPKPCLTVLKLAAFIQRRYRLDPSAVSEAIEPLVVIKMNDGHLLSLSLREQTLIIEPAGRHSPDLHVQLSPFSDAPPQFLWPWRTGLSTRGQRLKRCFTSQLIPWPTAARTFLDQATSFNAQSFQLICTDPRDGQTLIWGYGPSALSIEGEEERLALFFNGYTQLFREMVTGQLNCQGSMENIANLADEGLKQWIAWPC